MSFWLPPINKVISQVYVYYLVEYARIWKYISLTGYLVCWDLFRWIHMRNFSSKAIQTFRFRFISLKKLCVILLTVPCFCCIKNIQVLLKKILRFKRWHNVCMGSNMIVGGYLTWERMMRFAFGYFPFLLELKVSVIQVGLCFLLG